MYSVKHHSMLQKSSNIKENFKNLAPFDFVKPTAEDICLITKSFNPGKAAVPDCIPLKVTKFAPKCY